MKIAIICGTVFGAAEDVARHAASLLNKAGHETLVNPRLTQAELLAYAPQALLGVTSTTGMGELPDNLQDLFYQLRDELPAALRGLPGAVIALGDSAYDDTFCGGGAQLRELFGELGVTEIQDMLRLDASETVTPDTDAEPWLAQLIGKLG